ncbi:conserved hypothetical protein [Capnocytophaga canimorsus]|nr:glycosyltransferase family 2 protein [Capnocytophaga canimorsus]CEN44700.1 conserved hypothetical protein [Capnocytophaga canimorsus]
MNNILFSICIPSYNRPQELLHLLESIDYSQKQNFEIVICEDKSPKREEIREVVQKILNLKSRYEVVYVENEINLGYDKNLKALINIAQGNFIIFMGDDDTFIPNTLDKFALYLKDRLDYGYILRAYQNVYQNGSVEKFQYFSADKDFSPSNDTYISLFDKSVFISGFTINRKYAKDFETSQFDGSLLYQLYLLAEVTRRYPSGYFHSPITQAVEGGTPFFGSSEIEKDLYTPGSITVQNSLNFMNWYLKIINHISEKYRDNTSEIITLNMSKYSYPVLAIQRNKGRKIFKKYAYELKKMGYGKKLLFLYLLLVIIYTREKYE